MSDPKDREQGRGVIALCEDLRSYNGAFVDFGIMPRLPAEGASEVQGVER